MTGSYHDRQQNHETTTKRPPVDNQEITRKPPGDKTIQTPPGDNEPPRGHQHTRPKCFPQVLLRHSGEHNVSPIIGGFGSIAKMSFPPAPAGFNIMPNSFLPSTSAGEWIQILGGQNVAACTGMYNDGFSGEGTRRIQPSTCSATSVAAFRGTFLRCAAQLP